MRRSLIVLAGLVCLALFVGGLAQLFKLRFEGGDVYPEYSSLRADPLGTMALYEALDRMPGITVERDFSADNRLPEGKGATYLHLGARTTSWQWISDKEFQIIESFVTRGGRLAITFFPERTQPRRRSMSSEQNQPRQKDKDVKAERMTRETNKKGRKKGAPPKMTEHDFLKEKWGLEFGFIPLEPGTNHYDSTSVEKQSDLAGPDSLEWHSGTILKTISTNWHTVYARGTNPVIVERSLGAGSVVMATDSYFLSNEALRKDPHAELLSWWVGPSRQVVFDEAHFGIVEQEGVSTLLKKYHLYGLVGALCLLTGLFVWKNSLSFVPLPAMHQSMPFVSGRDSSSGFVNLLRRNVPARELLRVCFAEWKKSRAVGPGLMAARQAQIDALIEAESKRPLRERDPVATYQEICRTIKKL
jgi:hypothetical protein